MEIVYEVICCKQKTVTEDFSPGKVRFLKEADNSTVNSQQFCCNPEQTGCKDGKDG